VLGVTRPLRGSSAVPDGARPQLSPGRADPADPQRNRRAIRHPHHPARTTSPAPAAIVCLAAAPPAPR